MLHFTKMSGAGNDFIVIDNRSGLVPDGAKAAVTLCDRHWGIGGDGLLLLEASGIADFRMMYYNADGSYGGMCGNGGRCIAQFAFRKGITGDLMAFEALDHIYTAKVSGDGVILSMKDPGEIRMDIMLPLADGNVRGHYIDTGAPHVVILNPEESGIGPLESVDMTRLGKSIRYHDMFTPKGTNVNVVEVDSNRQLKIRTYERGVETETLACGTGSVAAAVIAVRTGQASAPVDVHVMSGSVLTVDFRDTPGGVTGVKLAGPAVETFQGTAYL